MRKIIISLPLVLATILTAAASTTTVVAYGQDWLIGPPNDNSVQNSTQSESEADRLHEQRLQQRLQEKGMVDQRQQQQAAASPTTTTTPPPSPTSTVPADYVEVRSTLFGAVISYPPDWELRPPYNSPGGFSLLHVFAPEGEEGEFTADRPNVNIDVSETRGMVSAADARAQLEEHMFGLMTVHEQLEVIESVPATLAGQQGWKITYTFTSLIDGEEQTNMQIMAGIAGRTYQLSYSSPADLYDEYLPEVQNMINSFRVE
jgi:hypothetical protein